MIDDDVIKIHTGLQSFGGAQGHSCSFRQNPSLENGVDADYELIKTHLTGV